MAARLADDSKTADENAVLRRLVAGYRHLSSLAGQDSGISPIVEIMAERADTAVAVVDDKMAVLAAAEPDRSAADAARLFLDRLAHPRLAQVFEHARQTLRALRIPGSDGMAPIIVAPIAVGDTVPAYLLAIDAAEQRDDEDVRLLLTEHAATICGVVLGRDRVVAASATQARYDLVEGLLSGKGGDADEVRRWAAHLGYDEDQDHRVLSIVFDAEQAGAEPVVRMAEAVERHFTTQLPDAITAVRGDEVVVVLPEPDPDARRSTVLATECINRMREMFRRAVVTAGIGGTCRSAADIRRSYDEARRTVEIAGRMGRTGTAVALEDLGIHRLLLQVAGPAELREFVREVFGGLLAHPRNNAMECLTTLACYFRENNSPQRASRVLHVHPNTVTYRVRRVEELANLDFRTYGDRLMAQIALEILDVVGDAL